MNSLERSLQIGLVVSLVVLMTVFLWAGSLTSRLLSEGFVYRQLEEQARTLLRAIDAPPIAMAEPRLDPRVGLERDYEAPLSGEYFIVRFDSGLDIRSRSAWEQTLLVPTLAPGQAFKRRVTGVNGEELLMWLGGFSQGGHAFTIAVASDFTSIDDRLRVFRWYFAAIALVLVIALLAVQHMIVRRSVRQLDAIRGELEQLEHGQADSLSEDVPREIMPLVLEFNRLLSRFDKRTRQSRNAVGNLAHALKGPMNLLMRAADSAAYGDVADTRRTEAGAMRPRRRTTDTYVDDDPRLAIAQNAERIRQLIESELKRARLAGRGGAGQVVDLETELQALTGLLGQVYAERQVDIRWQIGTGVELLHDRQDMLELIGNLLDNAVKWADSVVMLTVRSAEGILLEVEDDGVGCTSEELALLTGRGVRLDESVAGHGLGLSIVRDIVETYDGRLELGRSVRLGGFRAVVHLPASA